MMTNRPAKKKTTGRDERGSVLVFVVGVLVLLALAATAYLSTARVDRVTAKQNEFTTQIDLLLEACRELAKTSILTDKTLSFNVAEYFDTASGATSIWSTPWLASRVPTNYVPTQGWSANNPGGWTGITGPLIGTSFEAPTGQVVTYDPAFRPMLVPDGLAYGGRIQPVFNYDTDTAAAGFNRAGNTDLSATGGNNMLFAGDADGDGIADSLAVKLPVGKINGLEYYAYFRIIDNGSAINASTASSRWFDFDLTGNRLDYGIHGFFLGNVGMLEMLNTYVVGGDMTAMGAEFGRLNTWKFNTSAVPSGADLASPTQDNDFVRTDMNWLTVGDAMHHQLAMRVDSPGRVRNGTNFQAFQISDSSALASRFILRDSLGSLSPLETALQESIAPASVRNTAYPADQAQSTNGWYDTFFEPAPVGSSLFDPALFRPRRALITADSRFRQMTPTIYATAPSAAWPNAAMNWNAPTVAGPTAATAKVEVPKVAINVAGFGELFRGFWQVFAEPTASNVANTGTIFDTATINTFYSGATYTPYLGMAFNSGTQAATSNNGATAPTEADRHPAGMFRSPIRATANDEAADPATPSYAGTPYLSADQTMILRAAIAAKNLLSMRLWNHPPSPQTNNVVSSPDVATSQDITIQANIGGNIRQVTARIYGVHRQPYLTEVFAQNDTTSPGPLPGGVDPNPRGYIAIEFYNPHDIPIDITECRFGLLRRHGATDRLVGTSMLPNMELTDATKLTEPVDFLAAGGFESNLDTNPYAAGRVIIPARGYLVMENYRAAGPDGVAATYRPGSSNPAAGLVTGWSTGSTVPITRAPERSQFNLIYVKNLDALFNREFILMRPTGAVLANRAVPDTLAAANPIDKTSLVYTNTAASVGLVSNFAPLDSFDLSGLLINRNPDNEYSAVLTSLHATAWHYQRRVNATNPPDATSPNFNPQWEFVYPGRYDGSKSEQPVALAADPLPRQQGTGYAPFWTPGGTERDPWDPNRGNAWSNPTVLASQSPTFTEANPSVRQDKVFTVQVWARDWPGINYLQTTGNTFPFGKFARVGDLINVPFIGSYLIFDPSLAENSDGNLDNDRVLEVNPITMDAAMAEDTDPNDDGPATSDLHSSEQIGRFAPLGPTLTGGTPTAYTDASAVYNDYGSDPSKYRYRFGRRLFDFFSVYAPSNDYMPNVRGDTTTGKPNNEYGYWTFNTSSGVLGGANLPDPVPVDNAGRGVAKTTNRIDGVNTNDTAENSLPVHGLININTAPVEVLSLLPWIPNGLSPANGQLLFWDANTATLREWQTNDPVIDDNQDIARAIVFWRDGTRGTNPTVNPVGPFLSPFDLYKIPGFRTAQARLNFGDSNGNSTADDEPDDRTGDLSPYDPTRDDTVADPTADPTTDGIRRDFEEQFLLLNRVSNLITTRSDTYTVYILLQGWRNAGSAAAELVVERRAAMIVDRSQYTPGNGNVTATRVPTN